MPVQRCVLAVAALATCLIPTAIGEWRCGTVPNDRKGIISNECGLDSAALLAAFAHHSIVLNAQLTCGGGGRYQTTPAVDTASCDAASAALTALFVLEFPQFVEYQENHHTGRDRWPQTQVVCTPARTNWWPNLPSSYEFCNDANGFRTNAANEWGDPPMLNMVNNVTRRFRVQTTPSPTATRAPIPVTLAPTTVAPATVAPATLTPTTSAPATSGPTLMPSQRPTTEPPTTAAPMTASPSTASPASTPAPSTRSPTMPAPFGSGCEGDEVDHNPGCCVCGPGANWTAAWLAADDPLVWPRLADGYHEDRTCSHPNVQVVCQNNFNAVHSQHRINDGAVQHIRETCCGVPTTSLPSTQGPTSTPSTTPPTEAEPTNAPTDPPTTAAPATASPTERASLPSPPPNARGRRPPRSPTMSPTGPTGAGGSQTDDTSSSASNNLDVIVLGIVIVVVLIVGTVCYHVWSSSFMAAEGKRAARRPAYTLTAGSGAPGGHPARDDRNHRNPVYTGAPGPRNQYDSIDEVYAIGAGAPESRAYAAIEYAQAVPDAGTYAVLHPRPGLRTDDYDAHGYAKPADAGAMYDGLESPKWDSPPSYAEAGRSAQASVRAAQHGQDHVDTTEQFAGFAGLYSTA